MGPYEGVQGNDNSKENLTGLERRAPTTASLPGTWPLFPEPFLTTSQQVVPDCQYILQKVGQVKESIYHDAISSEMTPDEGCPFNSHHV